MKYLFDTDVVSNLFKRSPALKLLDRIRSLELNQQYISSITVLEIVYGACRSEHKDRHLRNLEEILLPNVNVLNFDLKAAYLCGRIQAELSLSGTSLFLPDLQIASIAIANDLTLVSGNIKHFSRIKTLKVENWLNTGN